MNSSVDTYLDKKKKWQPEMKKLRNIILDCGLNEEFKWMNPCYTFNGRNVVLIHGFKDYCALLFFKGALLGDPNNILVQQTENVQAARQIRFTDVIEIEEKVLKPYIYEAIEVEKSGKKVELKKTDEFPMPEEFKVKLDEMPKLKSAFEELTPGRQRGYLLYFSDAKQAKTRVVRIEKYIPEILEGKGLNDR